MEEEEEMEGEPEKKFKKTGKVRRGIVLERYEEKVGGGK